MAIRKIRDQMKRGLRFLFLLSDRISTNAFRRFDADWILEVGVHAGELARHNNGLLPYVGFEANPANMEHFGLDDFNVHNYAVMPNSYQDSVVEFEIPIRNSNDVQLCSGKGSVLKRKEDGWGKFVRLQVPAVRVSNINRFFDISLTEKQGKAWIDAEGISVGLAREIVSSYNVTHCHFEFDFKSGQYSDALDMDIDFLSGKRYFRARTSHDQYNVVVFDAYNWRLLRDIGILKIIDITISCAFVLKRALRKVGS